MTKPDLREIILAHLRSAGEPLSSRDLVSRFLLIRHGEEATCHRLIAPYLAGHPSLEYAEGNGWSYRQVKPGVQASPPEPDLTVPSSGVHPVPRDDHHEAPLQDFVALAAEGGGPSGSGRIRVVSLQPVVGGEECSPEHLPAWAAEDDPDPVGPAPLAGRRGAAARAQVVGLETAELQILVETVGDLPVVCHRVAREAGPLLKACAAASLPFHPIPYR